MDFSPRTLWQILILIILLIILAVLSGAETAFLSVNKIRIRHMVEEEIKNAALVSRIVENTSKLLGTILVGSTASNIAASALATSIALKVYGEKGVAISTVIMTFLVLIFAEITPKSISARNPELSALKVSKVISFLIAVLNPIVIVLTRVTGLIIRIFGGKAEINQPFITEEELKTMVDVSQEEGVLEAEEKEMIHNVFEFGDLRAKDVMVQRMDIVAIDVNSSMNEIVDIVKNERFSRIPVYRDTIDDIVGILNVKDLILFSGNGKVFDIDEHIREVHFTYEFKRIIDLFREMKKNRAHMSVVLDEYGGVSGIITIEDLIEEIVGEIEDEYDEQEEEVRFIEEGEYVAEGSARLELVNEIIGTDIESEEFDSIGGFIIGELGRFPEKGEVVKYGTIRFVIEDIDKNRVRKVRIFLKE